VALSSPGLPRSTRMPRPRCPSSPNTSVKRTDVRSPRGASSSRILKPPRPRTSSCSSPSPSPSTREISFFVCNRLRSLCGGKAKDTSQTNINNFLKTTLLHNNNSLEKMRCNCPFYLLPILCLIYFITKKSFSFSPSQSICPMSLQILFKVLFISNFLSFSLSSSISFFCLSLFLYGVDFFLSLQMREIV